MQIQVNTDNHIQGSEALTHQAEAVVEGALGRFGERITRVEIYLTDESSSAKARSNDKRCVMEARLAGLQPISASHEGSSVDQALNGAADKLAKTLNRTLERRDAPKGRTAYGGDQTS